VRPEQKHTIFPAAMSTAS